MTGYHPNGNYYEIMCPGDSGGPDFYWDGAYWNLVGVHSWGAGSCGSSWGPTYPKLVNASADMRPFSEWINTIVTTDMSVKGCKNLGPDYVCRARP